MKKIFNMMMAVAIAAFTFTACEDVPEPYNNPYNGAKIEEPVVIDPAGSGTKDDPWNVAALIEKTTSAGLADGAFLNDGAEVYVKGIVTETTEVSVQYGNATYYISDDAKGSNRFYVFRGKLVDGASVTAETDLQVGDTVVVCGKVKNYKGTLEFDQGNYLVSLVKGDGSETPSKSDVKEVGSKDAPKTVAEALTAINAMEDGATSEEFWFVKGKVVKVTTTQANFDQYKNLNYLISEDGTENNTITVYAGNGLDNAQFTGVDALKAGDEVVVYGQIQKYVNKSGAMTPEIAKGNYLVSYKSGSGESSGEVAGDGTLANPFNAAAANQYAGALAAGAESEKEVYIKGKIIEITDKNQFNTQYGNCTFYISDDGKDSDNKFYVFRTLYLGNVKYTEGTLPKAGDEVIICGKVMNYQGNTPETVANKSYIYSLNGKTADSGTSTSSTGTLENPLTASQAYDAVAAMEASVTSDADYYVKGKICSIKYEYSSNFGTATFNISDDGNTGTKEFIAYNCYYFGNQSWKDGDTQIKVGDEVIVCGKVVNYNGNTPEFASKKNWLVSLNGNKGNSQGGNASGNSVTAVMSSFELKDATELTTLTMSDGTKLVFAQEDGAIAPKYYNSGNAARMYAKNSVTISSTKKISKIEFECIANYLGNSQLTASPGSLSKDGTKLTVSDINATSVKVTNDYTDVKSGTQLRFTSITVTYAD